MRVAGDAGGKLRRQRDRLVERIGVQRLGATESGGHRLEGRADDVVVGILLLQRDARGLAMGAQHQRRRLLRLELRHDPRPQQPGCAKLGGFHEEVHADGEEEGEATGELVDIKPFGKCCAHIFAAVGQREGELLHQRRAGLLHMVAGDRDRVELRHLPGGVLDDIGDDAHRGFRRVDIGVADHELLEDVVLDSA
ncbi:hypothetical protein D9M72_401880 [compost metagenome]